MGVVEGRVVIVTGAGNGIGREHALLFAREGAKVVVNDPGRARDGSGQDAGAAAAVVAEIVAAGGSAVASVDDISQWSGAENVVRTAVESFGGLDVLVNNAGILRDRMLVNMSEDEWDDVLRVHLKGTFAMMRLASAYWRDRSKAGDQPDARVINTTSASGLFGNVGQANYGAAKAAITGLTLTGALELGRYGITVNAIAPTALTRMTDGIGILKADDDAARAALAPEHISPLVVWLGSTESAGITGRVFGIKGNRLAVGDGWTWGPMIDRDERWEPTELGDVVAGLLAEAPPNADMTGRRPVASGSGQYQGRG
jgi:NAD(P)-dependent dehydrogenase (short-subunit alcohol dehydrogenase family)